MVISALGRITLAVMRTATAAFAGCQGVYIAADIGESPLPGHLDNHPREHHEEDGTNGQ